MEKTGGKGCGILDFWGVESVSSFIISVPAEAIFDPVLLEFFTNVTLSLK